DAAGDLEGGEGGVVAVGGVGLAGLVPAPLDEIGAEAAHALDRAEQPVEHIAPVAQHVEDDAAALGLAIVPGRALRRLVVAREDPIAEIALDREDAAEEAGIDQR